MRRRGPLPRWVHVLAAATILATATIGCSRTESATVEMVDDPADVTIAGTPPTAPPSTEYDGRGLSSDANKLIEDLVAIQQETDLCVILTGDAFAPFLSGELDTTNLVTSPSGVSQLIVAVNSIFARMVAIAPPEVQPATIVLQDVWTRVATLNSSAADYDEQVNAILAEAEVLAAYQSLATWAATTCGTAALLTP